VVRRGQQRFVTPPSGLYDNNPLRLCGALTHNLVFQQVIGLVRSKLWETVPGSNHPNTCWISVRAARRGPRGGSRTLWQVADPSHVIRLAIQRLGRRTTPNPERNPQTPRPQSLPAVLDTPAPHRRPRTYQRPPRQAAPRSSVPVPVPPRGTASIRGPARRLGSRHGAGVDSESPRRMHSRLGGLVSVKEDGRSR